ncbi:hypothetical protein KIN20_000053 [Parelaphostrongylus tenuis]|uniref:Uncharacterized protein n=1 Tax=Parelaphostrongylus tenuis TaxID=148309 RepID=A0AAD5LUU5_PARTN|nr:hypothetical protein KIN20_000053 [Parelaphostrongylus tenuis]
MTGVEIIEDVSTSCAGANEGLAATTGRPTGAIGGDARNCPSTDVGVANNTGVDNRGGAAAANAFGAAVSTGAVT